MSATTTSPRPDEPGVLDALSLLAEVADELVVRTARDTHLAWTDRVHGIGRRVTGATGASVGEVLHRGIAGAVYGGLGARPAGRVAAGSTAAASTGVGPRLESAPKGRFLSSAVNGLIGDRLERERPRLAIPMAVRAGGRDVTLDRDALAAAYPEAGGRVVVLLHGLCENEEFWDLHREEVGTTYAEALAAQGWTPVSCAPTPGCRCARTASPSPRCSSGWSRSGRPTSPGSPWSATRWAGW